MTMEEKRERGGKPKDGRLQEDRGEKRTGGRGVSCNEIKSGMTAVKKTYFVKAHWHWS